MFKYNDKPYNNNFYYTYFLYLDKFLMIKAKDKSVVGGLIT